MATVGVKGLNQPSVGSCYCETEVDVEAENETRSNRLTVSSVQFPSPHSTTEVTSCSSPLSIGLLSRNRSDSIFCNCNSRNAAVFTLSSKYRLNSYLVDVIFL